MGDNYVFSKSFEINFIKNIFDKSVVLMWTRLMGRRKNFRFFYKKKYQNKFIESPILSIYFLEQSNLFYPLKPTLAKVSSSTARGRCT